MLNYNGLVSVARFLLRGVPNAKSHKNGNKAMAEK